MALVEICGRRWLIADVHCNATGVVRGTPSPAGATSAQLPFHARGLLPYEVGELFGDFPAPIRF